MSDYKLVPMEPTEEMIDAAREHHEGEAYLPVSVYKAMIAAAPTAQGEAVACRRAAQAEVHRLREWIKEAASQYDICTRNVLRKVCDGCRCRYRKQGGE